MINIEVGTISDKFRKAVGDLVNAFVAVSMQYKCSGQL